MQERKFNSAFRVSSKQFDSLKMQNSLDQLLGAHSRTKIEDCHPDSDMDIVNPSSTSTLIRCNAGPRSASMDKSTGFKGSSDNMTISDFGQKFFGQQAGLFSSLRNVLDQRLKNQNTAGRFDKDAVFLQGIIAGLTQQTSNYLPPFALETLKDDSNKIYTALEQIRSLNQKAPQTRRESFQEISSVNSIDEEIEMNTKPATQLNHLSISSANQLEDLSLKTINSDASSPAKSQGSRSCIAVSSPDFSNTTLQQRIEMHHIKNRNCKSSADEGLEGRGGSTKSTLGTYSLDERICKIIQYKKKIIKWRAAHPPNRNFSGRSAVAGSKPRIKGKFVKPEEYQKYMDSQKKTPAN